MKVIFLDVDGVLNSRAYTSWQIENQGRADVDQIDPKEVVLLKQIVDATGAEIVVTSTWRIGRGSPWCPFHTLQKELLKQGLIILDCTPILRSTRGDEIKAWMEQKLIESFVILDDDSDMGEFTETENFIHTSFDIGLTPEHVSQAIKVLNKQKST